ncbi:MAG TPA: hypothetical protein DDY81_03965, partial [Clostridiales bacterium]|nr:hypothetical protein [Clostridiales bacterium]
MKNKEFLDAILGLVSIESIARVNVTPEAPYGAGPAEALRYVLNLCQTLGIRTENPDGKVAWAEIGQGEEIVGVLGHLDTVPAGGGWTHDPGGELCGDRLYGRGVADDKGPTLAALFAMKELQDAQVPLNRRVRLIFGQCEESGDWDDMNYYKKTQRLPVFGFTPDADFPAIYGEKEILNFKLSLPVAKSGLLRIEGGDAANMVAGWCRCTYRAADGTERTLETHGRSAHASTPEKGDNAITAMMEALREAGVESPLVDFYRAHIGSDLHGVKMGCGLEDVQSGKLTLNAGMLRTEKDEIVLTLDIRSPVTFNRAAVESPICAACAPYGITCRCTANQAPVYMDKNGKVVQTMVGIYRECTGDPSEPTVIG